jgi:hypothetical protein
MSIQLAVNNSEKHIDNMNTEEMAEFQKMIVGLPHSEQTSLYEKILRPSLPVLQVEITLPDWLLSDFKAPKWRCMFGKTKKNIDFNIQLEDGSLLTAPSNAKFFYTIRYWLCVVTHPINNGGDFLKMSTQHAKFLRALRVIDALLIRGKHFQLSKYGFGLLTLDDVMALLSDPSVQNGVYQMDRRITNYLKKNSANVTNHDIAAMAQQYPTIYEIPDERTLGLTNEELIRSRVWLIKKGAYRNTKKFSNCNSKFFTEHLNKNTLYGLEAKVNAYAELQIAPALLNTEYKAVPVRSFGELGYERKIFDDYFATLKSLVLIKGDQFTSADLDLSSITFKKIETLATIKKGGRFRTLPASNVFNSLRNAFEFSLSYIDNILQAMADFVIKMPKIAVKNNEQLTPLFNKLAKKCCSPKLLDLGITRWRLVGSDGVSRMDNYFSYLRKNTGLFELYEVLMGCIQIIIGTIMARRASELIELKSDCLFPKTDPTILENEKVGYYLDFNNGKSGAGEDREELSRPITLAGAKLLWKLKIFREKLLTAGLVTEKMTLLLSCSSKNAKFTSIAKSSYSQHFNMFCDYFDSPVIYITPDDPRRYYIRQHQLRRFFAMVFFWGSGFDGLDTLRYFLGHTDAEHLYHYITENTPGAVLRGVKAETLIYGINTDKINGIEKLRELLKKRFAVSDITIEALVNTIDELKDDVEDGYLVTEPSLATLRQQLEQDTEILLQEGVIDLEPTFCRVTNANGEITQKIQLVLIIKEVEDEDE